MIRAALLCKMININYKLYSKKASLSANAVKNNGHDSPFVLYQCSSDRYGTCVTAAGTILPICTRPEKHNMFAFNYIYG